MLKCLVGVILDARVCEFIDVSQQFHYKAVGERSISFAEAAWFITPPEGVDCRTLTECSIPDKAEEFRYDQLV